MYPFCGYSADKIQLVNYILFCHLQMPTEKLKYTQQCDERKENTKLQLVHMGESGRVWEKTANLGETFEWLRT